MEEVSSSKKRRIECKDCHQTFDRVSRLNKHQAGRKIRCSHCSKSFCNQNLYQKHLRTIQTPVSEITDIQQRIQPGTSYDGDAGFQAIRLGKLHEISDWVKNGQNYAIINKAINHKFTYNDLLIWLTQIYRNWKHGFKLSIGFGFVLFNPISNQYKYYYVSDNNMLFDKAYTIDSINDINTFMRKVVAVDLPTNCYLSKPSSGWVLSSITNVQIKITDLPKVLLGAGNLPMYIKNCKSIIGLTHNRGVKYEDNLCFFRCLAIHHGFSEKGLERYAKTLLLKFEEYRGKNYGDGITIFDIPFIEICFKCMINVYTLHEDGTIEAIYVSSLKSLDNPLYLNLNGNHFSYISNIRTYGKKYKCSECNRIFDRANNFQRHLKRCKTDIEEIYLGGKFDASHENIFEKLEKIGIYVPEIDRYYDFISVFDFEAIQVPDNSKVHGRDILYVHIPATFSVCTNIPGYETPVHVQSDGSPQALVDKLVALQVKHQETASRIMREKFEWVFTRMAQEDDETLKFIKNRFIRYCDVLPIISFNGQRYDIPLIRRYLPLALKRNDSLPNLIIKKNRSYMTIGTDRLQYLDLTNYLAAGTSLSKFYHAYKVTSPKGFFPYEWFNSLSRLKETKLPQRAPDLRDALERGEVPDIVKDDPYYSILKMKTISNEEVDLCERVWKEQNMQNFGDFVKFYNDLDVLGLVEGIVKMSKIYQNQGLNMFKDAVSLPKLTQKQIFRPLKEDYFTTFSKKHAHIFKQLRSGIVGGPSIIFTRYQEKGVTKIKGGEICQKILGYDCNSMYLWAIGLPQCTGSYCLREKSTNFKKHSKDRENDFLLYSQKAINWLESIEQKRGIKIRHAENHPHGEKRIGNSYVDGFCGNKIFEFLGCYFHGHDCNPNNRLEEWQNTMDRLKKFEEMGYEVESILECEWDKPVARTPPPIPTTEEDILTGIMEGEIFGIVKCSLKVPPEKIDFFSAFPPIFKNVSIDLKDIGPHMKKYAQSIGREGGVKKSLISSMFGDDIVILSTLFKRYIEMGLVCTDIQWVLEYNPKPVFQWFVDKVADDRRRADLDPDMSIIGETSKTSGNSSYGYCCIDKSKHDSVRFCEQDELSKHVCDPFFKSLEELDGNIFEVVKGKRKVVQDTPVQVAIAVYSMAKLCLIEFWLFLKDHLDDSLYCLMETDTDSLYIAISKPTIDECVRSDKLEDWKKRKYYYFASDSEELVTFNGEKISKKQYEKRRPGCFKLEFSGSGMICLNSKVYHIWGEDDKGNEVSKTSSKGMQTRNALIKEDFMNVLLLRNDHQIQNAGFIDDGLRKITYTQTKKGLNYFYCKRIVLDDGINTTHLEI